VDFNSLDRRRGVVPDGLAQDVCDVWLVAAGRDTISQIVVVWLITTAIGFTELHHMILGTAEVMAGFFAGQGTTAADVGRVLVWATIGNVFGGLGFVAFVKYGHARPDAQTAPTEAQ